MEKTNKEKNLTIILFAILAVICVVLGIYFSIYHYCIDDYYDSSFIGALASLAGVFMFSAALVYQIREYKLQVIELKKSVEAQTISSYALDEQKRIMLEQKEIQLEQKRNDLMINMINNFNQFKAREEISYAISLFDGNFYGYFNNSRKIINPNEFNDENDFNDKLVQILKINFQEWFSNCYHKNFLHDYWQFSINIFYLIDEEIKNSKDAKFFLPFFHNQFTIREKYVLYMINTFGKGLENYEKLKWKYDFTSKFISDYIQRVDIPNKETVNIHLITQKINEYIK